MTRFSRTAASKWGRRGFVGDWVTIIVFMLILGVSLVFMSYLLLQTNDIFQSDDAIPAEGKSLMAQGVATYPGSMDGMMAVLFLGLPIVTAALIYFLPVESPFLWLVVLVTFVFVLIGAALGNAWSYMTEAEALSDALARFPISDMVFNNYAIYALLVGAVITIGLYMRGRRQ